MGATAGCCNRKESDAGPEPPSKPQPPKREETPPPRVIVRPVRPPPRPAVKPKPKPVVKPTPKPVVKPKPKHLDWMARPKKQTKPKPKPVDPTIIEKGLINAGRKKKTGIKASKYRLLAKGGTVSGWGWDIESVKFFSNGKVVKPKKVMASGYLKKYEPEKAFFDVDSDDEDQNYFGGRQAKDKSLWIGAEFSPPVFITQARYRERNATHASKGTVILEQFNDKADKWLKTNGRVIKMARKKRKSQSSGSETSGTETSATSTLPVRRDRPAPKPSTAKPLSRAERRAAARGR